MEIGGIQGSGSYTMHNIAMAGLHRASSEINHNSNRIAEGDISAERMVTFNRELFLYSMNIQLLKISDEMLGQVLETFA